MQEKLILVFYLPTDAIMDINENGYEENLSEYLKLRMGEENLPVVFYLPTDGDVRVECINPVVLSEEQFQEYNDIITAVKNSEPFNNLKGGQSNS